MANNMAGTQAIHDLVRDGQVTPRQGATLLSVRGELDAGRVRRSLRNSLTAQVVTVLGVIVLALLGIRKNS